ncbi:prephenate dehydrogenase [Crossiella sp. SN42]|uniref:prephenate dehydrogenase n=1 Tax=Crossiella sp. SN42 TaxID=2944808 RepID=UPI00207D2CAD|nr:prephenate dehydrogenase [Crossiella sp. SN42]MCO1582424.1 prephenate dehydrogenase [Crossiella sp. SN42]
MHSVCVLGLGLIGGSVLRAVRSAGYPAWGATKSEVDTAAALADGYQAEASVADALRRAEDEGALIVLAVPLTALEEVLRQVRALAPSCPLTDVVSVKGPVAEAVGRILPSARYVGGHPMAGSTESGWAAGSAELFRGAPWVVTAEEETDLTRWAQVARLAIACGAHVVPATPEQHDATVARISHLPHLFAAVLAAVGAEGGPLAWSLAAGSFADGTRVAGTRPELVRAMCEGNRGALLEALDEALGRLGAARGSLASTGGLAVTVDAGFEARRGFTRAPESAPIEVRIDLKDPNALDELLDLGTLGGRITSIEDEMAIGTELGST